MRKVSYLIATAALALCGPVAAKDDAGSAWVESWGTAQPLAPAPSPPVFAGGRGASSPQPPSPMIPYPPTLDNETVRMVVRTSIGGSGIRLTFRNASGGPTVNFGSVHAALARPGGSIDPASDRRVTFGGKVSATMFPGATIVSDPIPLVVGPLTDVAVSVHLPTQTATNTVHALGLNAAYIAPGDATAAESLPSVKVVRSYFWLTGLSIAPVSARSGAIVTLGDSITDGYATSPDQHQDWPELLAAKLEAQPGRKLGVINAGISGNRILKYGFGESALARFDQDVLARPGVEWMILLEGINDINMSLIPGIPASEGADADQIIAGLTQLVERAHLHGIRVAGATIMPTKGLPFYSARGEAMRDAINHWIRTSGSFDAVIDFDAATRDPADPLRLRPSYDPGDHVHPNDAGNRAMAAAIDPSIFHR